MGDLKLIKFTQSSNNRIQNKIDSFYSEFMQGDGDLEMAQKLLDITQEYLSQYEGDEVYQAVLKVRESIFYLDCFMYNE